MTLLSRSDLNPQMVTVQCDICCPPAIATNAIESLTATGWELASLGATHDRCVQCRGLKRPPRAAAGNGSQGSGRLPGLLLVGAAKCGTTSLHAYLDQHPDVFMAELKELRFFQDPDGSAWQNWYEQQFASDVAVVGESSTMYTRGPALPGVAKRAADLVPEARLIYMVRDPVDRAVASYLEERFQGLDPRAVGEAFADIDDPYHPYVSASRYAEQLGHFLEHYPEEQILVLPLADLERVPDETMRRVFRFVGVDDSYQVDTAVRLNQGATKYEYAGLAGRVRRSSLGRTVRRLPPAVRAPLQARARRLLSQPLERPELSPELAGRLRDALAPDAARFREMTGLALADWSV